MPYVTLLKTSRCRFFTDDGRPADPPCFNEAEACKYLHPCDPGWNSARNDYAPRVPYNAPKARRSNTQDADRSSATRSTRYSSPRIPQSDLFRLNVDNNRSDANAHLANHFQGAKGGRGRGAPSKGRTESSERNSRTAGWNKSQHSRSNSISSTVTDRRRHSLTKSPRKSFDGNSSGLDMYGDQIAELFKALANLSNQAVQHTAALNLEETKLKNYIELSSTLSRISNSAADAVAPKLAELISQRDRNKERLNSDFQDMGALWENIYNSFMQAVTGIIDNRLQNVMANLEKEPQAEAVNKSAASSSGTKRKEREFTISENVPPSKRTTSHEDFTHSKRRRVLTSGSVEEGELKPKAEVMEERFLRDMIVNDQVQRTEALAALSISNQKPKAPNTGARGSANQTVGPRLESRFYAYNFVHERDANVMNLQDSQEPVSVEGSQLGVPQVTAEMQSNGHRSNHR